VRWLCTFAAGVVPIVFASAAFASPSAHLVYLRNAGAESCPDETAVRSAVAARLGYDPFFPSAAETMFIEISVEKGQYRARVKLVDGKNDVRGTREIAGSGSACSDMIDTLALSISIAIDPDSLTRSAATDAAHAEPESAEPAPPPVPVAPPAQPEPLPAAARPEASGNEDRRQTNVTRPYHLELSLAPAVWFGSAPSVAFGGELGARLRWTHVSLGLSARADAPASGSIQGVDVSVGFLGGSAAACGHVSLLAACTVTTLGRLSATSNASIARDDSAPRLLLGASLGAELPASDTLLFFARAMANVAVGDQRIVLSGVDIYELPRFSVGFQLGTAVRF
jgi:hypothetical protein